MTYIQALEEILPYVQTISGDAFKENTDKLTQACNAMDILSKCPQELGFVCETHNYKDYVCTFFYSECDDEPIPLSEDEYNTLKKIFGDCQ